MEKQNTLPFPYEYEEIDDAEKAVFWKLYGSTQGLADIIRVGPKGYIVHKPYMKEAENIYNMPLKSSDVFVASYQRSGTTWTQELVWLVANNLDYTTAANVPLTYRYPFIDMFMMFPEEGLREHVFACADNDPNIDRDKACELLELLSKPETRRLTKAPEPRFIKTHLPMSLLPPKLLDTAKVVYVARDPRDVAVSCYHHGRLFKLSGLRGNFKEFWNVFHRGLFTLTPYFEHVKEAWEKRHHPNMLFLFYEELSKDLRGTINRVADFFGKKLNEEQLARLCDHLSIESFKKNKSVNFEEMREYGLLSSDETFVRKGKTGGWRDYFDEEMTQQAERWIADNLQNTDLRFPSS